MVISQGLLGVLAETSSLEGSLSLCVFSPGKAKSVVRYKWSGPAHSRYITHFFEEALKVCKKKNISAPPAFMALGIGPGRFTGVRVGLSFAKTVGFAYNIPIYTVSSLKILAVEEINSQKPVLVLVNAFKNSLYTALYKKTKGEWKELISPSVVLPDKLKLSQSCICVGDGYEVYKSALPGSVKKKMIVKKKYFPRVQKLETLVLEELDRKVFFKLKQRPLKNNFGLSWKDVQPMYLRSPVPLLKSPA